MRSVLGITLFLVFAMFSCDKTPKPCIEVDNSSAAVGTPITFNSSCTKKALSYIWSFEGPVGAPENNLQWSEETFTRAFSVPGTYTVTLTAFQRYSWEGQNAETTTSITIQ